jgi:hypothetical protein
MMTRQKRWAVGTGAGALAALACALWLYATRTTITEANAECIRPGMTRAEVEAILGGPARDESTGRLAAVIAWRDGEDEENHEMLERIAPRLFRAGPLASNRELQEGSPLLLPPPAKAKFWVSNRAQIRVDFDDAGRVQARDWQAVRRVYENPLDRLRRWLGL